MFHRARHLFIRQQTAVINAIRAHLAEFRIVAPVVRNGVEELLGVVADASDKRLPEIARACPRRARRPAADAQGADPEVNRMIHAWHRSNETSKRLDGNPSVGPALATALVASVADPRAFRSGRDFSAWIGLVPKQHSSGGKDKLCASLRHRPPCSPRPLPWPRCLIHAFALTPSARDAPCHLSDFGALRDYSAGFRFSPLRMRSN